MVDPRGPYRTVLSVETTTSAHLLTLECGHVAQQVTHMTPPLVGNQVHCIHCKWEGNNE